MAFQRYRVVHTDYQTSVSTDITEAVDISTREGIEATIDSFQLRITGSGLNALVLDVEDIIKIYCETGLPAPTDLIMDGVINNINYTSDNKGELYVISGVNKLEHVMHNILPGAFKASDGKTASLVVKYYIDEINDYNKHPPGMSNWVNIGSLLTATTRTIDYYSLDKPVFQHIEELSTDKYTGAGPFIYYLDTSNRLVWKPRPSDTAGSESATIEEGANIINTKIQYGVFGVINALVINCGVDYSGHKITAHKINGLSIGKVGWKWKYVAKTEFASNYIASNSGGTDNDVRTYARAKAKEWAEDVLEKMGAPRYKAAITVRGTTSYIKGNVYKLQMRNYTFKDGNKYYNLRLTNMRHNVSAKNGWTTTLDLEEDEDTAFENL